MKVIYIVSVHRMDSFDALINERDRFADEGRYAFLEAVLIMEVQ